MTRHGESIDNTMNIIGGDCNITENGKKYALFLAKALEAENKLENVIVWTSNLKRTKETAQYFPRVESYDELNEIYSGDFEGMSLEDIRREFPYIYRYRHADKVNNKYPKGENYEELKRRVSALLDTIELKENENLLIVAHQATCRAIWSYFSDKPLKECVDLPVNIHTLYKLENKEFIPVCSYS